MIDFTILDKKKTYIGLEYGTGFIAKQIIKFSKIYAPKSGKIPSHVFALVHRYGHWWIYESHADRVAKYNVPAGVRKIKANIWLEIENKHLDRFKAKELKLNRKELEIHLGEKYGMGDIRSLCMAGLRKNNGKQSDHEGLICSEYIALAHPQIQAYYNLPAWCITPAHWQNYLEEVTNAD